MSFAPILISALLAQASPQTLPTAPIAAPALVVPGVEVRDPSGAKVGTVVSVDQSAVVIDTGSVKVAFAPSSFTPSDGVLLFGMTRTEVETAAAKQAADQQTARQALLVKGTAVVGRDGGPIGTVDSVEPGFVVVVLSSGQSAKLPDNAVVVQGTSLAMGMTLAELQAAVAGAK